MILSVDKDSLWGTCFGLKFLRVNLPVSVKESSKSIPIDPKVLFQRIYLSNSPKRKDLYV